MGNRSVSVTNEDSEVPRLQNFSELYKKTLKLESEKKLKARALENQIGKEKALKNHRNRFVKNFEHSNTLKPISNKKQQKQALKRGRTKVGDSRSSFHIKSRKKSPRQAGSHKLGDMSDLDSASIIHSNSSSRASLRLDHNTGNISSSQTPSDRRIWVGSRSRFSPERRRRPSVLKETNELVLKRKIWKFEPVISEQSLAIFGRSPVRKNGRTGLEGEGGDRGVDYGAWVGFGYQRRSKTEDLRVAVSEAKEWILQDQEAPRATNRARDVRIGRSSTRKANKSRRKLVTQVHKKTQKNFSISKNFGQKGYQAMSLPKILKTKPSPVQSGTNHKKKKKHFSYKKNFYNDRYTIDSEQRRTKHSMINQNLARRVQGAALQTPNPEKFPTQKLPLFMKGDFDSTTMVLYKWRYEQEICTPYTTTKHGEQNSISQKKSKNRMIDDPRRSIRLRSRPSRSRNTSKRGILHLGKDDQTEAIRQKIESEVSPLNVQVTQHQLSRSFFQSRSNQPSQQMLSGILARGDHQQLQRWSVRVKGVGGSSFNQKTDILGFADEPQLAESFIVGAGKMSRSLLSGVRRGLGSSQDISSELGTGEKNFGILGRESDGRETSSFVPASGSDLFGYKVLKKRLEKYLKPVSTASKIRVYKALSECSLQRFSSKLLHDGYSGVINLLPKSSQKFQ